MIPSKWSRLCGSAASASVLFLIFSVMLVNGVSARALESLKAMATPASTAPSAFLVAPAIPLGYAPSSVATGALTQSGKLDLVTADYASGRITVFLGEGLGNFSTGVAYDAGPHPSSVAIADLNGDGRLDVLVTNDTEGTVSVLLGNGDGTLQSRKSFTVGFNPSFIVTGDFSGTGRVDVAVAGKSASQLAVLLNDGTGNLQKPILYSLSTTPSALVAADLNRDGYSDLALANEDGTISVLLGKGAGVFSPLPSINVGGGRLSSIAAADLNEDGKIDLVVTQPDQKLVSVLVGKGDGSFASPTSYTVGSEPTSTVVADVDGDGFADLVIVNKTSNTFSVLSGNGNGTFKKSVDFLTGNAPLAAVAGDYYGDGHVSLAIINQASETVTIPHGNGDGTFRAGRSYSAGVKPLSIASGNLVGSKIPGLVVVNNCGSDLACSQAGSVSVSLADSLGVYHLASTYTVGVGPVAVALADVNGDGNLDIVVANRLDKTVSVLLGNGDGSFRQALNFPLSGSPTAIAAGVLVKGGKTDLAVVEDCGSTTCSQPGSLEILGGSGDGNFKSASIYTVGYSPSSVAIGDLNGDKNLDIVVANRCGNDTSCLSAGTGTLLVGDGTGKFKAGAALALGNSPSAITLAHLSGSNTLDLVVARSADNTVAVLRGNGDASFQPAVAYSVGSQPGALAVADFDGDGHLDVAVTNFNDSTVSVLFGQGNGSFSSTNTLSVGSGPAAVTAISGTAGGTASLATANGNPGAASAGTEVSVLARVRPQLTGGPVPTLTLSVVPTPNSNVNDSVTLTATYDQTLTPTPTGAVTFLNGATSIPDCGNPVTPTAGVATCITQSLTAPSSSISATGAGDAVYYVSASNTVTQTVAALPATLSLTNPSPVAVNNWVLFTATLSNATFTPVTPSGNVTFSANTGCSPIAVTLVNGNWQAQCNTRALLGGADTVTASYANDTNFTVATSPSVSYSVPKNGPTLTVTSPGPSIVNGSVMITATLGGIGLTPVTPGTSGTGTISFSANTGCATQSVANVGGNWQATCTTSALMAGSDTVTATYSGDSNFLGTSGSVSQSVALASSTTLALTGTTTAAVNASVSYTATLTGTFAPIAPGGTINFYDGATQICSQGVSGTVSPFIAHCTGSFASLTGGSHTITASYSGDSNFSQVVASPASTVSLNVTALTPTIALSSSSTGSTSIVNTSVTFSAQLSGSFSPVPLSGTFLFKSGSTTITGCSAVSPNASGKATCITSALLPGVDAITAAYSGDPSYVPAAAGSTTQTVTQAVSTLALTGTTTAAVDGSVSYTATLTGTFTPNTPGGTITFQDGTTTICNTVSLTYVSTTSYTAACTGAFASLTAGSHSIKASYSGDSNFSAVAVTPASTVALTVTNLTPTVSLGSTGASNVDGSVTFTAQLSGTLSPTLPTGSFVFKSNGTTITGCSAVTVSSSGQAQCTTSALLAGSDAITAAYSGDTSYVPAAAGSTTQTVTALTPTLSLTPSPSSSTATGATVVFTAQLSGTLTPVTPTGTVTFTINGAPSSDCPSVTVTSGGSATCTTASLVAPADIIGATYSADNNYKVASPVSITQSVGKTGATTVLTSTTAYVNETVTLTATVTGATVLPTGTVAFTQGGTTLCAASVITTATGKATCNYVFTSYSTGQTLTATYSGDSNYSTGTPATFSEVVATTPTTTAVTSSLASTVNQAVVFTATVTPQYTAGTTVPTGSVVFSYNSTTLCTKTLSAGVVPTCSYTFLTAGTYDVVATYTSGDTNFSSSVSGATADAQVVSASSTTVTVSALPTPSTVDQQVTFAATVTATNAGTTVPQGTVTYSDGTTTLCAVTLTATGSAPTCTVPLSPVGQHTVNASYSTSNTNFSNATSNPITQTVNQTATAVAVSSAPAPSSVNQTVTFTATITTPSIPAYSGSKPEAVLAPTGTAAFSYTTTTQTTPVILCAAAAVSTTAGVTTATCAQPLPATGTYTIAVAYSGDTNFLVSSNTASQTVATTSNTTSVTASSSSTTVNQSVTFTATVTPGTSGTTNPTGTVAFSYTLNGGSSVSLAGCTAAAVSTTAGVTTATCADPLPTTGSYVIKAVYGGDANFPTSTGTANQTVTATATTTSVVSSLPSTSVNQSVTFTATVASNVSGSTLPTGTVAFSYTLNGGASVPLANCSAVAVSSTAGVTTAACSDPLPTVGAYTVTAAYTPGNTNFLASTNTVAQTLTIVKTANMTNTVTTSGTPSLANGSVTFTATLGIPYSGTTNPTGTVTFSAVGATVGSLGNICASSTVATVAGVTTATCSYVFANADTYTVTAAYSGDTNFSAISNTVSQSVVPQSGVTVTIGPASPAGVVNQAIALTATVLPGIAPTSTSTKPTGTVTFVGVSGATSVPLCSLTGVVTNPTTYATTATCNAQFPSPATWAVTATYSGDSNFAKPLPVTSNVAVTKATTTAAIAPAASIIVATTTVAITATLTPAYTGASIPSGTITFVSSDTHDGLACSLLPVTANVASNTSSATCVVTTTNDQVVTHTITATYSGDGNFTAPSAAIVTTFTVQNFTLANTPSTATSIYVTQGYSNISDPINPNVITVTAVRLNSFPDNLNATCVVTSVATGNVVTDPSCALTLNGNATTTQNALPSAGLVYLISASSAAPVGKYTVQVKATDQNALTNLSQVAPIITVNVLGQATTQTLVEGTSGTYTATFNTVLATSSYPNLSNFKCGLVWNTAGGAPVSASTYTGLTCTGPATATITGLGTANSNTPVQIVVSTGTITATLRDPGLLRSNPTALASFLGVPLFALVAWFGGRKSSRKNLLRFFSLVLLLVGFSFATGCGGSFSVTKPSTPTYPTTALPAGSYLIQVTATDASSTGTSSGTTYYAMVPLTVVAN